MKINDLLNKKSISLNANPKNKEEAIEQLVQLMDRGGALRDKEKYLELVMEREQEGTTGVGGGIAIPHGKGQCVNRPALAAMVVQNGVDFDSLDGEPVKLIFMISAPESQDNVHLQVLSRLSVMLMDESFVEKLTNAPNVQEFIDIIEGYEEAKESEGDKINYSEPQPEENGNEKVQDKKELILAVTACPTGIAHTYMAEEGLRKAADKLGCAIKVETRGSSGVKNQLTEEEIQEAVCIIVAADTDVPKERFAGKRLICCPVSEGISRAEELIESGLKGEGSIYEPSKKAMSKMSGASNRSIYTHLMNGVNHMLPFVVGGGILIAIAFLIDSLSIDVNSLSEEMKSQFGSITEAAALFKKIGDGAFGFMLPVLAGYIAMAIGDRPALAVGFVGGYLASTGQSGFLGALLIGFIAGYIVVGLKAVCSKLPKALEQTSPVLIYPLFGILIVGLIMIFVVEPPIGALNQLLHRGLNSMNGTSKVLLGIIVAAMMAIDMGGPFNKAAYVFGTAAIAEGNYNIMAAVMVGGMVPPCAIALATLVFKNKFTKEERQSGPTNFIMGLSFITEGAIPYAAADPTRVLPSCIIGSAIAGALSMAFGCTLMAPHGGIFVFPVVGQPLMYLLALIAGTITGAVMLGLLKANVVKKC